MAVYYRALAMVPVENTSVRVAQPAEQRALLKGVATVQEDLDRRHNQA